MSSTFSRLFVYARSSLVDPKENFTTEALAAAIRQDSSPFVRVLSEHGLLANDESPLEVAVQTQVPIRGAGIIDLLVELRGHDWTAEVWVEVKVDASESGIQLTHYQTTISASTQSRPPRLAVLSKKPLDGHTEIPWIRWQAVRRAAAISESPYWRDLALFLKEIHMADDYDEPIDRGEAASLLNAHSLYRKALRIIGSVADDAQKRWGQLAWPIATDVDDQVLRQFRGSRRLTASVGTAGPIRIFFGIAQVDESADFNQAEPHLVVWAEHSPKQTDLRRALLAQADAGALGRSWGRRIQGWWALTASEPLSVFQSHDAASSWIVDRFADLDRAGIIAYVSRPAGSAMGDGDQPESTSEDLP